MIVIAACVGTNVILLKYDISGLDIGGWDFSDVIVSGWWDLTACGLK